MKITVTFDVNPGVAKFICETSVERVINESIRILEITDEQNTIGADASNNLADWDDCKMHAVNMWNGLRDGIFREKNNIAQINDWIV